MRATISYAPSLVPGLRGNWNVGIIRVRAGVATDNEHEPRSVRGVPVAGRFWQKLLWSRNPLRAPHLRIDVQNVLSGDRREQLPLAVLLRERRHHCDDDF